MNDDWTNMIEVDVVENISEVSCVYFLMNDCELVYIGQTTNLQRRLRQHTAGGWFEYAKNFDNVFYIFLPNLNTKRRKKIEKNFIEKYQPKHNCVRRQPPEVSDEYVMADFQKVWGGNDVKLQL